MLICIMCVYVTVPWLFDNAGHITSLHANAISCSQWATQWQLIKHLYLFF